MTNVPDYSKPFDESFLDFVKNHKDVVLTHEKFQELLKQIDTLEKNLAGTEQTIYELLDERTELSSKTEQLKKKLGIAVKALEVCVCLDDSNLMRAESLEALKQIEED